MKVTFATIYIIAKKEMNPSDIRHYGKGYTLDNLCLRVNSTSAKLVDELKKWHVGFPVMTYRDDITREWWFDIPFAYPVIETAKKGEVYVVH